MKPKFHIIGGGINGIISALYAKKIKPDYEVIIHESSNLLGGALNGHNYPEKKLYFDKGTHIFQEYGNSIIDDIVRKQIGNGNLFYFPIGEGDTVGSVQNSKLNLKSHYIDIRNDIVCLFEVRKHINSLKSPLNKIDRNINLSGELEKRFGYYFAKKYKSVFANIFKVPCDQLSAICLSFVGANRIVLDDFEHWITNSENSIYRSLSGVPNQLELPKKYKHNRKSYYFKRNGTNSLVQALVKELEVSEVKILLNSKVSSIDQVKKQIISNHNDSIKLYDYDKLLISSGVISANKLLGINQSINLIPPINSKYIHLELEDITLNELFYFYNFDSEVNFYRVTNYRAFSSNKNDKRITIECLKCEKNSEDHIIDILNNLKKIGFIKDISYKHLFVEYEQYGFPTLSVKNIKRMKKLNKNLNTYISKDLKISGIGTADFNFFQPEIVNHSISQVELLLD
jgi:protoporphyrinogen oxidase